jgi:hypothetical protein
MLKIFQQWKEKKAQQKLWLEFHEELAKNLESYYVMDQIGRFRFFRMESWQKLKNSNPPPVCQNTAITTYISRLEEYNSLLDDFTKYEQWYASDLNNKTPANGRILHEKREKAREKFQGLEPIIKSALHSFENHLLEVKLLK